MRVYIYMQKLLNKNGESKHW